MKVVIIEDERLTAEDLAEMLMQLPEKIEVSKMLSSVSDAVQYFRENEQPDLIFCDIHLGDGHSFEIFKSVRIETPVIFCTAFDEFALEAFRNNGIDYILKPFSKKSIKIAIDKYNTLRSKMSFSSDSYSDFFKTVSRSAGHKKNSSLLVNWKDKIIPVKVTDIALFNIEYKMTQLITFGNQKYYINHTLDELEDICGSNFYRANRQYLVNKESVQEALQFYARKLVLKLKVEGKHEIIISKNKVPEFLGWLKN